jgi:small-conductance mechanosensitive channel
VTLITGAGTLILGLSWLIGGSLQEVLSSIIFLFIKHPFDVGDRVIINGQTYTVKEIRLLSTTFLDANSTCVQAPNNALNTLVRPFDFCFMLWLTSIFTPAVVYPKHASQSTGMWPPGVSFTSWMITDGNEPPQMSETFAFDVSYGTNFADLEKLREVMLKFLEAERRDYHANFDVNILSSCYHFPAACFGIDACFDIDIPDQDKMSLNVEIKFKSNAQLGSLRCKHSSSVIRSNFASCAHCLQRSAETNGFVPSKPHWLNARSSDLKETPTRHQALRGTRKFHGILSRLRIPRQLGKRPSSNNNKLRTPIKSREAGSSLTRTRLCVRIPAVLRWSTKTDRSIFHSGWGFG